MRRRNLPLTALATLFMSSTAPRAETVPQGQGGLMDAVIKRGTVLIGMDMSAPPFAYEDQNQQPAGSEVETARLLAKDLGVQLQIVPTTAANRIPYLVTGRVDLMMGAFAIFADRAKAVWFSSPYGTVTSVILAPRSTTITSYADLVGKKISVSRGTYTEQVLMAAVPNGAEIVRFDDDPQAMAALASGQADAYGVGNVPGSQLIRRFPDRHYEIKITIPPQNWYAFGVRKGAIDLLQWVNTFVFLHRENGDFQKIYEAVIGDKLPPLPTL